VGLNILNLEKKLFNKSKKDYIYNSYWLNKLINNFMKNGEKIKAEQIIYQGLKGIKKKSKLKHTPLLLLFEALEFIKVDIEVVKKKIGKTDYFIPHPTTSVRQYKTALKWFQEACKKQKSASTSNHITTEVIDIVQNKRSYSLLKKKKLYEIVVYFRTHLHYRWK
jgi:ribosomal protein S7